MRTGPAFRAPEGGDQPGDLIELLGRTGAVTPRRRKMGGERRGSPPSRVRTGEPTSMPRHFTSSIPASPNAEAIASNVPPIVSVAEVSTVVDPTKQLPRNNPATDKGANP